MALNKRDYGMLGLDAHSAVERGLKSAEWYHTDIDRKQMKTLMQRSDRQAIIDTALWLGLLIAFAGCAFWLWPTPWAIPFLFCYGVLYGSASDSRWHECGHGTAFKTTWMNDAVYQIACFMIVRNPATWRWSHTRHHTDTIIVGLDPEIAVMRPPVLVNVVLNFFGILDTWAGVKAMFVNSAGILTPSEKTYVPQSEWQRVIFVARVWVAIYAATIAVAFYSQSWLPILLVGTPRLYGAWHHVLTGLLQHGGLADDVLDHRMNSRTVYMNPVSRFIYWNMNYHIEHHMFPMVPYHALPELHKLIAHDLPVPDRSMWAAYRQVIPVWLKQLQHQDTYIVRALPITAKPYRPELDNYMAAAAQ